VAVPDELGGPDVARLSGGSRCRCGTAGTATANDDLDDHWDRVLLTNEVMTEAPTTNTERSSLSMPSSGIEAPRVEDRVFG
jgi:hypothetical protein